MADTRPVMERCPTEVGPFRLSFRPVSAVAILHVNRPCLFPVEMKDGLCSAA